MPGKSDIAYLLSSIADDCGYLEVHAVGDFGEPTWRSILSKEGKTLEAELEREAAEVQSVKRAVSAGLLYLVPYLQDDVPEIRRFVAVALDNHPEHAVSTVPALQSAIASEADDDVRKTLRASVERLTRRSPWPTGRQLGTVEHTKPPAAQCPLATSERYS